MAEIIWKQGKPEEHETFLYKKHYGTDRWNDKMFKTISDRVLVTIEHGDKCVVDIAYTVEGKWQNTILSLFKDARVVAYADYPAPFSE